MSKSIGCLMGATLILVIGACQREAFRPEAIDQDYLTLGKGGGMTNQVDTYYVLADGYAYLHNRPEETHRELGHIDKADRTRIFRHAAALSDSVTAFREPGNIYYFLSIHTQDTTHAYTWGSNDFVAPEVITDFYQSTTTLIQNLP